MVNVKFGQYPKNVFKYSMILKESNGIAVEILPTEKWAVFIEGDHALASGLMIKMNALQKALFQAIELASPYGTDISISKIECVGHIKKRMGFCLRKIKKSGVKCCDGKFCCGKRKIDRLYN